MEQCSRCNELMFRSFTGKSPKCGCKEFIIIDEDGEEWPTFAHCEHSAALKYAEKSNQDGDYYLMNETAQITVDGKSFSISAEPDVYYSASEVTAQEG